MGRFIVVRYEREITTSCPCFLFCVFYCLLSFFSFFRHSCFSLLFLLFSLSLLYFSVVASRLPFFFSLLPPSSPSSLSLSLSSLHPCPSLFFYSLLLFIYSLFPLILSSFLPSLPPPHPLHSNCSLSLSLAQCSAASPCIFCFSPFILFPPSFPSKPFTCLFSFFPTSLSACFVLPLPLLSSLLVTLVVQGSPEVSGGQDRYDSAGGTSEEEEE